MNRANNIRFLLLQIGRVNRRSIKELGTSVIAREHFARQFRANNTRVIITNYIQDEIHRCINFHPLYHYLIQIVKMNNVSDFFFSLFENYNYERFITFHWRKRISKMDIFTRPCDV